MRTKRKNKYNKKINKKQYNKTKKHKKCVYGGEREEEREQYYKDLRNYREKFIKTFNPILSLKNKTNLNQNDTKFFEKFYKNMETFFIENKNNINTLISIKSNREPSLTDVDDYVSIPIIIIDNIKNNDIKKKLINLFVKNGGNINLINKKHTPGEDDKIDVFNRAVELQKLDDFKMLLDGDYGLNRNSVKEKNKALFDKLLRKLEEVPVAAKAPVVAPEAAK